MDKYALQGIKVLELDSGMVQYAGKMLADMGADVIKVEPPEGASSRKIGPYYFDEPDLNQSLHFWHYNTSKRSATLDLNTEDGKRVFNRLLQDTDVLLDGLGKDKIKSFGIEYEELLVQYPELIYVYVTPFGADGPWSDYLGSDIVQLSLGGVMGISGYDDIDGASAIAPSGGQTAHLTSLMTGIAVLSAIHARMNTGKGDFIDLSSHETIATSLELPLPTWEAQEKVSIRHTGRHCFPQENTPRWIFPCSDGKHIIALTTYLTDKRYKDMVEWFDSYGLAEDLTQKYHDGVERQKNLRHIGEVIGRFCAHHSSDYIFHEAQKRRLPWGPVNAADDLLEDPHLAEDRNAFQPVEHPELEKTFLYPGDPYTFHGTPWRISKRPPLLGEHTREVLQEIGIDDREYRILSDCGSV